MDDVLMNKIASIERCLKRIEEEYIGFEQELETNYTRQDSIVLNLQRACEASIDAAMHIVRINKLGVPQESRNAFELLENSRFLNADLAQRMKKMVGFRNVAVHDYQKLNSEILKSILENHLGDFRRFSSSMLSLIK